MKADGPRVFFKGDDESRIGRGAVMYGAHFRPEVCIMIWAVCRAVTPEVLEVHVTEGYRKIRDTRDLHQELRALDFTLRNDQQRRPGVAYYENVASKMRHLLGPDYDVIAHGEGSNLHIHAELDP